MNSRRRSHVGRALVLLGSGALMAGLAAADWPQFRGPQRAGTSAETGLQQEWSAGGPQLAWQVDQIGAGYSSAVVQGDVLWITGDVADELIVSA